MMRKVVWRRALGVLGLGLCFGFAAVRPGVGQEAVTTPDLLRPASIFWDHEGIPHIFADSERDTFFLLGYVQARDRFFQIDFYRHVFAGTLAEMFGAPAIGSDVQFRRWDLERAAEESYDRLAGSSRRLLRAYADGVNVYLRRNPLPVEYTVLELGPDSVEPWRAEDSLLLLKGFSLGSWLDLSDLDRTLALEAYRAAGAERGFDGDALFDEDVFRGAPIEPTVTIPDGLGALSGAEVASPAAPGRRAGAFHPRPETLELGRQLATELRQIPLLSRSLDGDHGGIGSNWWLVDGRHTTSGRPILANDPHQFLSMPPVLYEVQLTSRRDDVGSGPLNVTGVTFAGLPAVVTGCNRRVCWGATNNRLDITDVFEEQVVFDPATGLPRATVFRGHEEPLRIVDQAYRANVIGDGVPSNTMDVELGDLEGGKTFFVPRRNGGPLLSIGTPVDGVATGLSVQYAGFSGSLDLEAFLRWHRARNVYEFRDGLRFADGFLFNMAYADTRGHIAYFATGEMPLRDDLQNLARVDGAPPWLIRDGTGAHRNEWIRAPRDRRDRSLDYEVLPLSEMPAEIDPPSGMLVSANNDPLGTTLDNDPLNQRRRRGGILYYDRSFVSLRATQITRLLGAALAAGPVDEHTMKQLQSDQRLLDAELTLPYLFAAYADATAPGAPKELAGLVADPRLVEAVERLGAWDFSTPTGIQEGYDPGDDPEALPDPAAAEIDRSVAATLFSVWRGQLVRRVIDHTLEELGLGAALPSSRQAHVAMLHQLRSFDAQGGRGASGVDFFAVDGVADPQVARDVVLLDTLRATLDRLAGEPFETAFGGSTELSDYRWGKLHRIVLAHPLGGPFNVPPAGSFIQAGPQLPGLARGGGFEAIDTGTHDARAQDDRSFRFTLSPGRRYVATLEPGGIEAYQILPGGESGDPTSPEFTSQLGRWLTNGYAPVLSFESPWKTSGGRFQTFVPAP
ncbi:MAG: penicillin acylase family protein [Acidobacteria bacterium]|nr:penicillin acylase family protein [Acidobacteriota bacterium]